MKVVGMDGLKNYHQRMKELLNEKANVANVPTTESGTWTPETTNSSPFKTQPYKNATYTRIGNRVLLNADFYMLFDSDKYPVNEYEKEHFTGFEYVTQEEIDNLSNNYGYTFSDKSLSTGEFLNNTVVFKTNSFPFRFNKFINASAFNYNRQYYSGNIAGSCFYNSTNYAEGAYIYTNFKVWYCNEPHVFTTIAGPDTALTTVSILYEI